MSVDYFDLRTAPQIGDILWCHFPLVETPGRPGPKPRPALVREIYVNSLRRQAILNVAFGTSQKTDRIYPGEFVIASGRGLASAGLLVPTKFDLSGTLLLPWAREFFTPAPWRNAIRLGSLHPADALTLLATARVVTARKHKRD